MTHLEYRHMCCLHTWRLGTLARMICQESRLMRLGDDRCAQHHQVVLEPDAEDRKGERVGSGFAAQTWVEQGLLPSNMLGGNLALSFHVSDLKNGRRT